MLSAMGRAHARKFGVQFTSRDIKPIVISSPTRRCREAAANAFCGQPIIGPDLRAIACADAVREKAYEVKAQSLLARNRGMCPVIFISIVRMSIISPWN